MAMPFASLSPAADHRSSSLLPFCRAAPLSAVGEDAAQHHHQRMMSGGGGGRWAPARPALFTAAQYEELEHQALIYKYLVAGVPVPPDLLVPLRRGFVYHQPALGYVSYFGKVVDPEPGRCRRTDGKKWRCAKEAAPDSKYCERHMHRGRNRSRKPVEAPLVPPALAQQQAAAPAAGFPNHSLYPSILAGNGGGGGGGVDCGGGGGGAFGLGPTSQLPMDSAAAYATAAGGGSKDLRYSAYGVKSLSDGHSQLLPGGMDTSLDNSWRLLPSQTTLFQAPSYPVFGTLSGLDESTVASLPKTQREPLSFFGSDFVSAKQDNQTLRPFFDEWPKSRDSWPAEDNSLGSSATQLSISIPMATSDFSNTSSRSPHGIPSSCR